VIQTHLGPPSTKPYLIHQLCTLHAGIVTKVKLHMKLKGLAQQKEFESYKQQGSTSI